MAGRIDDAAVALTAYQGIHLVHLGGNVHLSNGRSIISASVGLGNIPEGPAGREIRYGSKILAAGLYGLVEQIICNGDEGILFHERSAVLADEGETVHVRIHAHAKVGFFADYGLAEANQVFGQRFGVVGEITARFTVERDAFHAEALQQAGHYDAAHGIDGIQGHFETGFADGFCIHGIESEYGIDVLVGIIMFFDLAKFVHVREIELALLGAVQDGLALCGGKELSVLVQKLEGVPLARVVGCSEDDASVRSGETDCQLGGRSGCEAAFHHVHATGYQRSAYKIFDHYAADTGVTAYYDLIFGSVGSLALTQFAAICISKLDDVDRGEGLSRVASNSSPDT